MESDGPIGGPRTGRSNPMSDTRFRTIGRLLRRVNAYTLWAFNPQPELTSRYERG